MISNIDLISRALSFASLMHRNQPRKYTGEPYIHHPVEVALLVASAGGSDDEIAAALLHDTVEDTDATHGEICDKFGPEVGMLVFALTDVTLEYGNRAKRREIDRARLAAASAGAQSIKCADLIVNTRDIADHDPGFARDYLPEKRAVLEILFYANDALKEQAWAALRAAEEKIFGPLAALVEDQHAADV